MTISFETSRADFDTIHAIVRRVEREGRELNIDTGDRMTLVMDLVACHANGNPLDLPRLLDAPKLDFWHDIGGIRRHIDRETGRLTDSFSPRFSARQTVQA